MRPTNLLALVLIGAFGLSALYGCGSDSVAANHNSPITPAPVLVRLASVEHTSADLPVRAVGKLEAKEELRLSFKIGGIIEKMYVDEGQTVTKGQLLATLSLTEIDAQLAQAQNGFDKAERDLKRVKNLFADSVATLEQLQNATTAWEVSKAALGAAAFNRKYAQIFAPSDGRILRRTADDHEQIASGAPVLVLAGYSKGWIVRAGLADRDLMRVRQGDPATIEFDALPGKPVNGFVSEIGAAPNPINGTYDIEIRVTSSADRLITGLIGKITLTPESTSQLALVPIEALVDANGDNGFVYTPTPDQRAAKKIPVIISYVHEGKAGVLGDLPGISSVITAGATKLTDGATVAVVK